MRWLVLLATIVAVKGGFGQVLGPARPHARLRQVPFVGCTSDGQVGPLPAPTDPEDSVEVNADLAPKLAYYKAAIGPGVLAPRGWSCFGTYGSGGSSLYVTGESIDARKAFPVNKARIKGPVIVVTSSDGDTSGRFVVATVIARVFPAHRAFVERVTEMFDFFAADLTFNPFPADKLLYRSDRVVEYTTPPNTEGLGTMSWLAPSRDPVAGVAILEGRTPNLLLLSMRLPADLKALGPQIVERLESEAAGSVRDDLRR